MLLNNKIREAAKREREERKNREAKAAAELSQRRRAVREQALALARAEYPQYVDLDALEHFTIRLTISRVVEVSGTLAR